MVLSPTEAVHSKYGDTLGKTKFKANAIAGKGAVPSSILYRRHPNPSHDRLRHHSSTARGQ